MYSNCWEDKCHNDERPPLPPFPELLLLSMTSGMVICYGISFQSVGVNCLDYVHSQPLAQPKPSRFQGAREEKDKASTVCKHCSAAAKSPVHYQSYFSHRCKAQHHTGCYHPSQTQHRYSVPQVASSARSAYCNWLCCICFTGKMFN